MVRDPEINALSNVYDALKGLNNPQIKRIIDWVTSKFDLDKQTGLKDTQTSVEVSPPAAPLEDVPPVVEPVIKKRTSRAGEEPAVLSADTEIIDISTFDTFQELFNATAINTIGEKILLASAYLYQKNNLKEFSTSDINSLLKIVKQRVPNISASINNLLMKKPPLLMQTGKLKTTKHSRRSYTMTEEGLRKVREYFRS